MIEAETQNPTGTDTKIIEAAIRCFLRYGARKTSMGDIAKAASVSRQTLYDLFGNKDELICASIRAVSDESLADIRARLVPLTNLGQMLDAYYEENVVKSFEMLQVSDDPQDLISGHNEAGRAEIAKARRKHEALIAECLEPYGAELEKSGHSVEGIAHYFVTVTMSFKYEATDLADLEALYKVLRQTVLSAVGQSS